MKINFFSKLGILFLLLLCAFLGSLRYRQWKNQVAIEKEKRALQEQISSFNKKNQDLSDSLAYLDSADFKDRVARQQLNLKRNGEVVFGFVDAPPAEPEGADGANSGGPNYEKWVNYFFGDN